VDYSADVQIVATLSSDPCVVKLREAETGSHLHTLGNAGKSVQRNKTWMETCGPSFSPDGRSIATYKSDNTPVLWDPSTGKQLQELSITTTARKVVFSPDSQLLLVLAGRNRDVTVWGVATGSNTLTLEGHEGHTEAISISPNDQMIAVLSQDSVVRVWNLISHHKRHLTLCPNQRISVIAFSMDGSILATASTYNSIWLWNTASGT
ncbi:quinon protein alcohol dehydrogenase-like superfamily, partial [Fusarium sp. MPI-SDFR-AT-0072]